QALAESGSFNNKVDIWAIGCILYRIIFGTDAFTSDYALYQYCKTSGTSLVIMPDSNDICNIFLTRELIEFVISLLYRMLDVGATQRPSARQILKEIQHALAPPSTSMPPQTQTRSGTPDIASGQVTSVSTASSIIPQPVK